MFDKELAARPDLDQYKKQAKELARDANAGNAQAAERLRRHHPAFHGAPIDQVAKTAALTEAQLVIAREHGFESWPKFARHIELMNAIDSAADLDDPVAAFIEVASVPRHTDHSSGNLAQAQAILSRYPEVETANVYTAALLGNSGAVARFLRNEPELATENGGPRGWDALTYLCFSRYLRIDTERRSAFVETARQLLEAGADANTGWEETIDHPRPRVIKESAIYGAAGVARNVELTRLLLEYGADPNDEETPYHVPEGYENSVMQVILDSGRVNQTSLSWLLVRKADWHDFRGLKMVLEHGGDPNLVPRWGNTPLQHALLRDNSIEAINLLLDHGADPDVPSARYGRNAWQLAAHRGRGDALEAFRKRGFSELLHGANKLIGACASGDGECVARLEQTNPTWVDQLRNEPGALLAEFAGTGNLEGIRLLFRLGLPVDAEYDGDAYFDIAKRSTALHVAAWRMRHSVVRELIARGANVNACDGKNRTPLQLAVKACIASYWMDRRTPESIKALVEAGASADGIEVPCGYSEADELLKRVREK